MTIAAQRKGPIPKRSCSDCFGTGLALYQRMILDRLIPSPYDTMDLAQVEPSEDQTLAEDLFQRLKTVFFLETGTMPIVVGSLASGERHFELEWSAELSGDWKGYWGFRCTSELPFQLKRQLAARGVEGPFSLDRVLQHSLNHFLVARHLFSRERIVASDLQQRGPELGPLERWERHSVAVILGQEVFETYLIKPKA